VANIPELARIGHKKGVTVVVDNTFAPMVLSPARLGADVVVHSVSKFISGAADIIAGLISSLSFFSFSTIMTKIMNYQTYSFVKNIIFLILFTNVILI
jgi:cystathionine beta-lyase/cystathionine gamma-synthase